MPSFENFGLLLWHEGQDCVVLTKRSTAAFTVIPRFLCDPPLYLTFQTKKMKCSMKKCCFLCETLIYFIFYPCCHITGILNA